MENITQIISNVLSTELLAPSPSALAAKLGYSGKISLYRLQKGTAGENAVNNFCSALNEKLHITTDDLVKMDTAIHNTSHLMRIMHKEMNIDHPDWPFQALLALICHDYSLFSSSFKNKWCYELMSFEERCPEDYFNMLFYFYIRATNVKFHRKGISFKHRCAEILKVPGSRLSEIFPENITGLFMAHVYSTSKLFDGETPILWNLITTGASLLEIFANPSISRKISNEFHILPGSIDRNYWSALDGKELLLCYLENPMNNYGRKYHVFHIDKNNNSIEAIGLLVFLSDTIAEWKKTGDTNPQLAVYSFDGENLIFEWEHQNSNPTGVGNHWHHLELKNSENLRKIDKHITPHSLTEAWFRAEGLLLLSNKEIIDITVSAKKITHLLVDGSLYSIHRDDYQFLQHITPDEPTIIYQDSADGEYYIHWLGLNHRLPLSALKKD